MTVPAPSPSATGAARPDMFTVAAVLMALSLPASLMIGRAASGVGIALAVIALAIGCVVQRRWPPLPRHCAIIVPVAAILALCWLPSIIGSLKPLASVGALGQVLGCLLIGCLALGLMDASRIEICQKVFVIACALALAQAMVALLITPEILRFRSGSGVIRAYLILKASASIVVGAVPVLILLGWRLGGWWRWLVGATLLATPVMMVGSHSKSSAAGLIAAAIVTALLILTRPLGRVGRIAGWIGTAAAGSAALIWALGFTKPVTMGGFPQFAPVWLVDAHRQVIWQFALGLFKQKPWFGWGLSVINDAPGAGDKIPELGYEFIPSHTHDWVVQILSEAGLVGAVPLMILVLGVAILLIRRWYRNGEATILAAVALWTTFWTAGLFNFSLWNAWWQSSLALMMAMILASATPRRTP